MGPGPSHACMQWGAGAAATSVCRTGARSMGVAASAGWRVGADHPACLAQLASRLGVKSMREWKQLCKSGKLSDLLPADPSKKYKDKGWISWGHWLGTGAVRAKLVPAPARSCSRGGGGGGGCY